MDKNAAHYSYLDFPLRVFLILRSFCGGDGMKYLTIFVYVQYASFGACYYAMLQLDNYKIKINQKIERFFC